MMAAFIVAIRVTTSQTVLLGLSATLSQTLGACRKFKSPFF